MADVFNCDYVDTNDAPDDIEIDEHSSVDSQACSTEESTYNSARYKSSSIGDTTEFSVFNDHVGELEISVAGDDDSNDLGSPLSNRVVPARPENFTKVIASKTHAEVDVQEPTAADTAQSTVDLQVTAQKRIEAQVSYEGDHDASETPEEEFTEKHQGTSKDSGGQVVNLNKLPNGSSFLSSIAGSTSKVYETVKNKIQEMIEGQAAAQKRIEAKKHESQDIDNGFADDSELSLSDSAATKAVASETEVKKLPQAPILKLAELKVKAKDDQSKYKNILAADKIAKADHKTAKSNLKTAQTNNEAYRTKELNLDAAEQDIKNAEKKYRSAKKKADKAQLISPNSYKPKWFRFMIDTVNDVYGTVYETVTGQNNLAGKLAKAKSNLDNAEDKAATIKRELESMPGPTSDAGIKVLKTNIDTAAAKVGQTSQAVEDVLKEFHKSQKSVADYSDLQTRQAEKNLLSTVLLLEQKRNFEASSEFGIEFRPDGSLSNPPAFTLSEAQLQSLIREFVNEAIKWTDESNEATLELERLEKRIHANGSTEKQSNKTDNQAQQIIRVLNQYESVASDFASESTAIVEEELAFTLDLKKVDAKVQELKLRANHLKSKASPLVDLAAREVVKFELLISDAQQHLGVVTGTDNWVNKNPKLAEARSRQVAIEGVIDYYKLSGEDLDLSSVGHQIMNQVYWFGMDQVLVDIFENPKEFLMDAVLNAYTDNLHKKIERLDLSISDLSNQVKQANSRQEYLDLEGQLAQKTFLKKKLITLLQDLQMSRLNTKLLDPMPAHSLIPPTPNSTLKDVRLALGEGQPILMPSELLPIGKIEMHSQQAAEGTSLPLGTGTASELSQHVFDLDTPEVSVSFSFGESRVFVTHADIIANTNMGYTSKASKLPSQFSVPARASVLDKGIDILLDKGIDILGKKAGEIASDAVADFEADSIIGKKALEIWLLHHELIPYELCYEKATQLVKIDQLVAQKKLVGEQVQKLEVKMNKPRKGKYILLAKELYNLKGAKKELDAQLEKEREKLATVNQKMKGKPVDTEMIDTASKFRNSAAEFKAGIDLERSNVRKQEAEDRSSNLQSLQKQQKQAVDTVNTINKSVDTVNKSVDTVNKSVKKRLESTERRRQQSDSRFTKDRWGPSSWRHGKDKSDSPGVSGSEVNHPQVKISADDCIDVSVNTRPNVDGTTSIDVKARRSPDCDKPPLIRKSRKSEYGHPAE